MKNRRPTRKHKHAPFQHIQPLSPDRVEKLLYGETLPNQHNKQRLEEKRKGTLIMPDLQTALQNAIQKQTQESLHATINEWSQDDQPRTETKPEEKTMTTNTPAVSYAKQPDGKVRFVETVGVARAVFDYVQKNQGKTRLEVRKALLEQGYKKGSVDSLMTQNVRAGIFMQTSNGALYSLIDAYKSVPSGKAKAKALKQAASKKAKPKASVGIAALKPDAAPIVAPTSNFDPKAFLDTLSIMQARALYDELRKVFGG